jgi:serine/threonine protein kinase
MRAPRRRCKLVVVRGAPDLVPLPEPGETLGGKYAIIRVVGEGGMGVVYEAQHVRLRQRVAIKALLPKFLPIADVVARFEREGRTAAQLRSRHVARILDVDVTPKGLPFIVMEYLEGRDLDTELQQRRRLPVGEAVGYVLQACQAMEEAHAAGIVHRDLKPANLFLCPDRGAFVVKVLDFGISKSASDEDARLTGTHSTVGTPLYMSPEQVRTPKNVDARTDIWSLGVILFELLTGRPPFLGSTTGAAASIVIDAPPRMRDLGAELPEPLEQIVLRALEKDPKLRFQDVQSFAAALSPFATATALDLPPLPSSPDLASVASGASAASALASAETVYVRGPADAGLIPGAAKPAASPFSKPPETAPGWSTRSASRPRRNRWQIALLVLGLAGIGASALVFAMRGPASHPAGEPSALSSAPPPPDPAPVASPAIPPSSAPAPDPEAPPFALGTSSGATPPTRPPVMPNVHRPGHPVPPRPVPSPSPSSGKRPDFL